MDLPAALATVDELVARPFSVEVGRRFGADSGLEHHVVDLRTGDWLDEDAGTGGPYDWPAFEADQVELVAELGKRWGPPRALELAPVLRSGLNGEAVPPVLDLLSNYVPELSVWSARGRWVGVGVGQWGKECPVQLVLMVTGTDVSAWCAPPA